MSYTEPLQDEINSALVSIINHACSELTRDLPRATVTIGDVTRDYFHVSPYVDGGHGVAGVDYVSHWLKGVSERLDTRQMHVQVSMTLSVDVNGVDYGTREYTLTAKYSGGQNVPRLQFGVPSWLTDKASELIRAILLATWEALNIERPMLRHELELIAVDNVRTKVAEIERWTAQMFVAMGRQDAVNPVNPVSVAL